MVAESPTAKGLDLSPHSALDKLLLGHNGRRQGRRQHLDIPPLILGLTRPSNLLTPHPKPQRPFSGACIPPSWPLHEAVYRIILIDIIARSAQSVKHENQSHKDGRAHLMYMLPDLRRANHILEKHFGPQTGLWAVTQYISNPTSYKPLSTSALRASAVLVASSCVLFQSNPPLSTMPCIDCDPAEINAWAAFRRSLGSSKAEVLKNCCEQFSYPADLM